MMNAISLFSLLLALLGSLAAGQGSGKYCTVCRVLITEVEWLISQVDPKKSIQVGSFRVDPQGNQKIKDKQYARSDTHLEEIFETVCDRMLQYAELAFEDGTTEMVRTVGLNGELLETKSFNLNRDKGRTFRYQCDNFLDNHEEELIALLQLQNIPDYEKLICGEKLEVCTESELLTELFTLPPRQEAEDVVINYSDAHGDVEPDSDEGAVNEDDGDAQDENEGDSVMENTDTSEEERKGEAASENDDLLKSEDTQEKAEL